MTDFEQTVLRTLGVLEERSETQSRLLQAIQETGCARGHADRADIATLQREQSKLWKYARAMSAPGSQRKGLWGAIGTLVGGAAIVIINWLSK